MLQCSSATRCKTDPGFARPFSGRTSAAPHMYERLDRFAPLLSVTLPLLVPDLISER